MFTLSLSAVLCLIKNDRFSRIKRGVEKFEIKKNEKNNLITTESASNGNADWLGELERESKSSNPQKSNKRTNKIAQNESLRDRGKFQWSKVIDLFNLKNCKKWLETVRNNVERPSSSSFIMVASNSELTRISFRIQRLRMACFHLKIAATFKLWRLPLESSNQRVQQILNYYFS